MQFKNILWKHFKTRAAKFTVTCDFPCQAFLSDVICLFFFPFVTFPLICLPRILCQNCRLPLRHYQASDKQVVFTVFSPLHPPLFPLFFTTSPPRGTTSKGIADHVCWARSVPGGHGHRWGRWGSGLGDGAGSCFGQASSQANSDLFTRGPLRKPSAKTTASAPPPCTPSPSAVPSEQLPTKLHQCQKAHLFCRGDGAW